MKIFKALAEYFRVDTLVYHTAFISFWIPKRQAIFKSYQPFHLLTGPADSAKKAG